MHRRHFSLLFFLVLFLPLAVRAQTTEHLQASLIAERTGVEAGKPFTVGFLLKVQPQWHVYWMNPGDSGMATTVEWELPEGWKAGALQWPLPKVFNEPGDLTTYGYADEVLLMAEVTPPATLAAGEPVTLRARVNWLVCRDICVPGEALLEISLPTQGTPAPANGELFSRYRSRLPSGEPPPFSLEWRSDGPQLILKTNPAETGQGGRTLQLLPITEVQGHPVTLPSGEIRIPAQIASVAENLRALLIAEGGDGGKTREGWYVEGPVPVTSGAGTGEGTGGLLSGGSGAEMSVPKALGLGLIGGFILNLMPCVLPVIALKVFGFLGQAGESRRKVFRIGLAFTAGIYVWFLAMAMVVIGARAFGGEVTWAFQFQDSRFVLAMAILIFVFSLNLLGVYEIWLPGSNRLVDLSSKEGYGGAFMHGIFATLLATPCMAPYLGAALSFAFSQSTPVIIAMFLSIATGMGLPYVILTAQPAWMRFLPKPGAWMERLKQFMGFLLLGTVIWLAGIYGAQKGPGEMGGAYWILLGIGMACWIFGSWFRPGARMLHRGLALAGMIVFILLGILMARPPVGGWETWSPERVNALRAAGKPIFVDFTAEWCVNCKYNERVVLDHDSVRAALSGYTLLKADYTRIDPVITAELKRLGRAGVPVYLVYPPGGGEPELLPELLTREAVIEAVSRTP